MGQQWVAVRIVVAREDGPVLALDIGLVEAVGIGILALAGVEDAAVEEIGADGVEEGRMALPVLCAHSSLAVGPHVETVEGRERLEEAHRQREDRRRVRGLLQVEALVALLILRLQRVAEHQPDTRVLTVGGIAQQSLHRGDGLGEVLARLHLVARSLYLLLLCAEHQRKEQEKCEQSQSVG